MRKFGGAIICGLAQSVFSLGIHRYRPTARLNAGVRVEGAKVCQSSPRWKFLTHPPVPVPDLATYEELTPLAVDKVTPSSLQLDLFDSQGDCTYSFPNDFGIVSPSQSDAVCRDGICPPMSDLPLLLVLRPTDSSLRWCLRSSGQAPAPAAASYIDMFVWSFDTSIHHAS